MRILVMGATGHVGGALVSELAGRDVEVRAVSRSPGSWPDGVEGVVADPGEPDGLTRAAEGVDAAFVMSGYAAEAALLAALDGAHVVLLSASSAERGESGNTMAAMHLDSETAVRESGLPFTILRPCSFQSNVTRWLSQLHDGDVVRGPFGDVPVAVTDPRDIAQVAALALITPGHESHTYRLSGPAGLTPVDQVAVLANALRRPLRFEPVDEQTELPEGMADAMRDIFRGHPDLESDVQPTVPELLGRPAGSFEDWVERHLEELREG